MWGQGIASEMAGDLQNLKSAMGDNPELQDIYDQMHLDKAEQMPVPEAPPADAVDTTTSAPGVGDNVGQGTSINYDIAASQMQSGTPASKAKWAQTIIDAHNNPEMPSAPEDILKMAKSLVK